MDGDRFGYIAKLFERLIRESSADLRERAASLCLLDSACVVRTAVGNTFHVPVPECPEGFKHAVLFHTHALFPDPRLSKADILAVLATGAEKACVGVMQPWGTPEVRCYRVIPSSFTKEKVDRLRELMRIRRELEERGEIEKAEAVSRGIERLKERIMDDIEKGYVSVEEVRPDLELLPPPREGEEEERGEEERP